MFRKLVGCLLIIGMLAASSLTAFAAPVESSESTSQSAVGNNADTKDKPDYKDLLNSVIKDASSEPTDEFLVNIIKPSSKTEVVTYKSYNICGTPIKSDLKVFFARYNSDTKTYQLIANTDGDTYWAGNSQFFSNDISLENGPNKIKVVAYRTTQEDDLKRDDIQVTTFTITYVEKTLIDKALDIFNSIFAPKNK
jgi:hypothetical protein